MRLLVFGDRNWTDARKIEEYILFLNPEVIIEGEARGADSIAAEMATHHGFKLLQFPANWEKYGKAAGHIRNTQMIEEGKPTHGLGFHHDITKSRGSANMRDQLIAARIPVLIVDSKPPEMFQFTCPICGAEAEKPLRRIRHN